MTPLSYLIGADEDRIKPDASRVIEGPYDAPQINGGKDIAYCNLFHEDYATEGPIYAPYLPDDDTSSQYGEGRVDPRGAGWRKNLDRQYDLRRTQGHTCIELDNPDSYEDYFDAVLAELDLCGFDVVAKNSVILSNANALKYVAHRRVVGLIIEKNALSPDDCVARAHRLREMAGKLTLPIWFVAFGDGKKWAEQIAEAAKDHQHIGVTYSDRGEYQTVVDILPPQGGADMAWHGRQTALRCHTIDDFKSYLAGLSLQGWRPAGMTLHNTATPNRARWDAQPGEVWLRNLKSYYQGLGWSAGPHAFVDGNDIWIMTDFNVRGVHSPSYNASRLGIEMVADFNVEDDDSGIGLKVKLMTAELFAVCHAFFGWEPSTTSIKLHKEDPATDHDCPGKDIEKSEFIRLVTQYMGDGGDHNPDVPDEHPTNLPGTIIKVPAGDFLNLRETASAGSKVLQQLANGTKLTVLGSALNGATKWLRVRVGNVEGWVAAFFVDYVGEKKWVKLDNVTATVFGGVGDTQPSAYPPFAYIDPNKLGCALPYKYRGTRPHVKVIGPGGSAMLEVLDLGPWNTDNAEYCIQGRRPAAEQQFKDHARAQNGRVPTNDAGIDLTPAAARAVGISGKGKVTVEIEVVT